MKITYNVIFGGAAAGGGPERIKEHNILFNKIWASFRIVAKECHKHGGRIAMEWPKGCEYWPQLILLYNNNNNNINTGPLPPPAAPRARAPRYDANNNNNDNNNINNNNNNINTIVTTTYLMLLLLIVGVQRIFTYFVSNRCNTYNCLYKGCVNIIYINIVIVYYMLRTKG